MKKYLIILLSLLALNGCAVVDHLNGLNDPLTQVNDYISRHEYAKALALMDTIPAGTSQARTLNKKRKTIFQDIKKLEQQTITTALKQERQRNWPKAKQSYEDALQKLDGSQILEAKQAAMLKRFQEQTTILEYEELIVTGEELKKRLPLEHRLNENDPGDISIQWTYARTQNKAQQIGRKLMLAGEDMLRKNNLSMAQRLLPLAVELSPGPETESAASRLRRILQKRNVKQQKSQQEIDQKQDKLIMEAFNRAMALADLKEARKQLASLSATSKQTTPVILMQERLNRAIGKWVMEQVNMGDTFYRAGEYEQAQLVWQAILELLPSHEAVLRKSQRTQTIIDKLTALKERQSPED